MSTLGLNHAADHRLQTGAPRREQSFVSHAHAAGLDQLHVDAVKTFRATQNIFHRMAGFVGKHGQGRMFFQPDQIGRARRARHGLLDELDIFIRFGEPFQHSQGLFLRLPAFVGVHAHGFFRRNGTQSDKIFAVARVAYFEF